MSLYKIADLLVEITPQSPETSSWYEPYLTDSKASADIVVDYPDEKIKYLMDKGMDFTYGIAENKALGDDFNIHLLRFNGGHIHSSAVLYKGRVYLFSASSGVGKSTLTRRILAACPDALVINDDKPSFRIFDDKCIIYGTPFAGGTSIHENLSAELGGIVFIERSEKAELSRADSPTAIKNLLQQTTRVIEEGYSHRLLLLLSYIIENYPIYTLKCPNDNSPVSLLLEMMNQNK